MAGIVSVKNAATRRSEPWAKIYNCGDVKLKTKKGGTISWRFKQLIIKLIIAKNVIEH